MNEKEVFEFLKKSLVEYFEIEPDKITEHALLYEDLDIDSIDAIDLMAHIKKEIGKSVEPSDFKDARTIQDIIETVMRLTGK